MATNAAQKKDSERTRVKLNNVRLSYPFLFKPATNKNDNDEEKKEYRATFILDKKLHAAEIKQIEAAVRQTAIDKWGKVPVKFKNPLRDGEEAEGEDGSPKEGYGDTKMFIAAKSQNRQQVVNRKKEPVDEEQVYAGCYVNTIVSFYPWEHPKNGKGVSAQLGAVQYYKSGERFGPGVMSADEVFEDLGDEDDDEEETKPSKSTKPAKKKSILDELDDTDI